MYTVWTSHLDTKEEKELFKNQVYSAREVLTRLSELINKEKQGVEIAELNIKIYDSPNWDYKVAHGNGFKSAINFVDKLITNLDHRD